MNPVIDLEKKYWLSRLAERERLATVAWESLRDAEIESGHVQPIDRTEFFRRTGGVAD